MNTINNTSKVFLDFKVTMHRSGKNILITSTLGILLAIKKDMFSWIN